jgi:hypothetical protein
MAKKDSIGPSDEVQQLGIIGNVMSGGDGGDGVLAAEAAGASAFVNAEVLPKQGIQDGVDAGLVEITSDADDLFYNVKLPEGWEKKSGVPDPRHISLLDPKGNIRASIFYKAAFYDRKADMWWKKRFQASRFYSENRDDPVRIVIIDRAGEFDAKKTDGAIVQDFGELPDMKKDYSAREKAEKKLFAQANKWLKKNYPKHENVAAYWDEA